MAKTDKKTKIFRGIFIILGAILIAVNFMNFFRNISSSTDENVFVEMYSPFYVAEDINKDCYVDFGDFAELCYYWLLAE